MSQPQAFISLQFGKEWRIRRPYLYRMLERQYVDKFFEDGTLRLSSFKLFREHNDEERRDTAEGGFGFVKHREREGDKDSLSAFVLMAPTDNCYIMCGTTIYDPVLFSSFGADSGFRINDTTAFGAAVSSHIPGFNAGIEGGCLYMANRTIERDIGNISLKDFESEIEPGKDDLTKMMGFFSDIAGDDFYFAKDKRFSHQYEYRLLWFAHNTPEAFIDIRCPEARQFCVRFEDLWDLKDKKSDQDVS